MVLICGLISEIQALVPSLKFKIIHHYYLLLNLLLKATTFLSTFAKKTRNREIRTRVHVCGNHSKKLSHAWKICTGTCYARWI